MLRLDNVSAGYGGTTVIKNISFNIEKNKNLTIIGPNGCGKTTLLKVMANLLSYTGKIELDSRDLRSMSQRDISLKIALLVQSSGLYFSYSVFDTVMMGRYPHIKDRLLGLPSQKDKDYVLGCLCEVGLEAEKNKEITKLSGGQLQRVFLARTLAQEPEIILLDEPTNHLDLKYQIELIEYLKKWSAKGRRAVVGVLHDINLAMSLGDDIMVMKNGEIQDIGATADVITDRLLERVYDIDVAGHMRQALKKWESLKK